MQINCFSLTVRSNKVLHDKHNEAMKVDNEEIYFLLQNFPHWMKNFCNILENFPLAFRVESVCEIMKLSALRYFSCSRLFAHYRKQDFKALTTFWLHIGVHIKVENRISKTRKVITNYVNYRLCHGLNFHGNAVEMLFRFLWNSLRRMSRVNWNITD